MNQLMLVVVAVVALCYCGGKYCPAVLRQNKEMILGVAAGLVLCSFFGMRLEGMNGGGPDVLPWSLPKYNSLAHVVHRGPSNGNGQVVHRGPSNGNGRTPSSH